MIGANHSGDGEVTRDSATLAATARLVVHSGHSERRQWLFYAGGPVRHLVVGSSSLCDWRVHARGVHPRHLRLCWNGRRLRVEDQVAPGSVRVAGRGVAHRLELPLPVCIEFGEARLVFEHLGPHLDAGSGVELDVEPATLDAVTPAGGSVRVRRPARKWWPIAGALIAVVTLCGAFLAR